MYTIPLFGNERRSMNAEVREYARLEYAREDVRWVLATVAAVRRTARTAGRRGRLLRRARPAHTPVAHKGSPRLTAEEGPSLA